MSQANAAARKRRAGGTSMPGASDPVVQQQQTPAAGLTLPQVIALVDRRLVTLETFMKDTKAAPVQVPVQAPAPVHMPVQVQQVPTQQVDEEVLDEINNRFELLAGEVAELKDILIKLQSYTMEVNKRLVDERIHILSDVKDTGSMTFDMKTGGNIVLELSDDE